MRLFSFKGGVHPDDGKALTNDQAITLYLPKGDLVFPISQHIGAPAKPEVHKGDKVLVGQIIASATRAVSANVISSVSGTVKAIEPRLLASGMAVTSIVVENDGLYSAVPDMGRQRDYTQLSPAEIRAIVASAGIVGLGGAGFPTAVKLSPPNEAAIDHIIVNCAECEPYLTSDHRLMLEHPEKLVGGLKVILHLFPKAKGVIAVEKNKGDAIAILEDLVKNEPNISVQPLPVRYPQGAERSLIYAITGRKLNSSKLPADMGCIVDNCDTVISIYSAVCESTPLLRRIVTVTGDAVATPRNFNVRLGTCYTELLEAAGGLKDDAEKIISGGPMMGMALSTTDIPVTKNSSALLCMTHDEVAAFEPSPCIRCGRCVDACPSRLVPPLMMARIDQNDLDGFQAIHGMECYECGCCTFVCPARRPLTQAFKQMRAAVMESRRKP